MMTNDDDDCDAGEREREPACWGLVSRCTRLADRPRMRCSAAHKPWLRGAGPTTHPACSPSLLVHPPTAARPQQQTRALATAGSPTIYRTLYQNVFKSNIAYLTYVFAGAIALEWVYSKGVDAAWEVANSGVRACVNASCP